MTRSITDKAPGYRQLRQQNLVLLLRIIVGNSVVISNACTVSGTSSKAWKHASVCFLPHNSSFNVGISYSPEVSSPGSTFDFSSRFARQDEGAVGVSQTDISPVREEPFPS